MHYLEDTDCLTDKEATGVLQPEKKLWRSDIARAVAEFHAAFDLPRKTTPSVETSESLKRLRVALLEEECGEFASAAEAYDLVAIADALADIVYVAYGTAITYGIDLDLVLAEVHRSNMSKLDESGQPIKRADGKIIKSERYTPPDVKEILNIQPPLTFPS